jgi:hypothetical protein
LNAPRKTGSNPLSGHPDWFEGTAGLVMRCLEIEPQK